MPLSNDEIVAAIGVEINPDYCAIAVRRLKNHQPELKFAEAVQ